MRTRGVRRRKWATGQKTENPENRVILPPALRAKKFARFGAQLQSGRNGQINGEFAPQVLAPSRKQARTLEGDKYTEYRPKVISLKFDQRKATGAT